MNVIEIVKAYLKANGCDGLCSEGCGCGRGNLAPCGELSEHCVPAVLETNTGIAYPREGWYVPAPEMMDCPDCTNGIVGCYGCEHEDDAAWCYINKCPRCHTCNGTHRVLKKEEK